MKAAMTTLAAVALATAGLIAGGCSSTRYGSDSPSANTAVDSATELGKAYYHQPNMAKIVEIEGANMEFHVTGATRFCLSSPVPTKQIIPREPSWYNGVADTLKTYAPWFFMAYWVHEGGFGNDSSTTTTTTTN